jgi:uncharacterized protein (DUF433 family)
MNWQEHISVDPQICHGRACITGTRVMVSTLLDNLAAAVPQSQILEQYPSITEADLRAALAYAAELSRARTVTLPGAA